MTLYLAHAGERAHLLVIGASVPCRVTAIGEWAGTNAMVTATVTAQRAAGGYLYAPGTEIAAHGGSMKPSAVGGTQTGWVWCDGLTHGPRCRECGDVHTVADGIPGRASNGVWVRGGHAVRCRGCGALLRYTPHEK